MTRLLTDTDSLADEAAWSEEFESDNELTDEALARVSPDKPRANQAPPGGKLMVCATPIGNLGDITRRVIQALTQADAILAEDTRVAARLCRHLQIKTPLERCDEHVIRQRTASIVERIRSGECLAYVSDAGTPAISDPGASLVAAVRAAGLTVEVLPGPSAVLTALVASGFTATNFYFAGFFPRKKAGRLTMLTSLAELNAALVFFESPNRVVAALQAIEEVFPDRLVCLAREMTKLYEEVLVDTASELLSILEARARPLKGEVVVVIDGTAKPAAKTHVDKYGDLANMLRGTT